MSTAKLEKLLINEVSGVDEPANLLPGWMIQKAKGDGRPFGPDGEWVVGDAEARIRKATGAEDAPTPAYAECFLWVNKDAADPSFGDFRFLINDVVDGEIAVMPAALKAVEARLDSASIPDADKDAIRGVVKAYQEKLEKSETEQDATSIVERIKGLLLGKEIDVTKEEMETALEARLSAFGDELAEKLSKSVAPAEGAPAAEGTEAPAAPEAPAAAAEEAPAEAGLTAEDVAKAIGEALAPIMEAVDKTLDRVAALERGGVLRTSIEGQDPAPGEGDEPSVPTVKSAIAQALGRGATA